MEEVTAAVTTGLGSIATSASGMIGDIIPVVVPIVGMIVLVTLGIRVFKKFTH